MSSKTYKKSYYYSKIYKYICSYLIFKYLNFRDKYCYFHLNNYVVAKNIKYINNINCGNS